MADPIKVPSVDAVKEFERTRNGKPWQNNLPYRAESPVSVTIGKDGNLYKCIQSHNLVAPYDDPKDPTDEANQGVTWELASGGAGTSVSVYDTDFEVKSDDRLLLAVADGTGEIKIATKEDFTDMPLYDAGSPENYNKTLKLAEGDDAATLSPIVIADNAENLLFQMKPINGAYTGYRSNFDGTNEEVIPFATPRPPAITHNKQNRATLNGDIFLLADDLTGYVLKKGATSWTESALNALPEFDAANTKFIVGRGPSQLFVFLIDEAGTGEACLFSYNPSTDEAKTIWGRGNGNTAFVGVNGRFLEMPDCSSCVYVEVIDTKVHLMIIRPNGEVAYQVYDAPVPNGASGAGLPVGVVKNFNLYFVRKHTTNYKLYRLRVAVTANPDSAVEISGVTVPFPCPDGYSGALVCPLNHPFFDPHTEMFYAIDDSNGRTVKKSKDLIHWETEQTFPDFPGKYLVQQAGTTGGFLLSTDYTGLTGNAAEDAPLQILTLNYSVSPERVNRYRVVGMTVDSKESKVSGKISEVTVQKIAVIKDVTGLTPGQPVFLGSEGAYTQDISDIQYGEWRVLIGYAVTSSSLDIQLGEPVYNSPKDLNNDSVFVGAAVYSSLEGSIPTTYMLAEGQELLRSIYSDLNEHYAKLGYPYGEGDGSTTFNLPNWHDEGTLPFLIKVRRGGTTSPVEDGRFDSRMKKLEDKYLELSGAVKAEYEKDAAAPGSQSFPIQYTAGDPVEVHINGIKLTASEFTATNGTSVDLVDALEVESSIYIAVLSDIGMRTGSASGVPTDSGNWTNMSGANVQSAFDSIDALLLEVQKCSKQLGELFFLDDYKAPSDGAGKISDYFAGICLDSIDNYADLSETEWPDLVPYLREKKLTYAPGEIQQKTAFDLTNWKIESNVGTLTFADATEEKALIAALLEDYKVHGETFDNWRTMTISSPIGDIPSGEYPITGINSSSRQISFACVKADNSGDATATAEFHTHRVQGSTTTARIFEASARSLVSANVECIAGLRRRDRIQGHYHALYGKNGGGTDYSNTLGTSNASSNKYAAKQASVEQATTDPTYGSVRVGKTTDPRALIGHLYMWGRTFKS